MAAICAPSMPSTRVSSRLEWDRVQHRRVVKGAADVAQHLAGRNVPLVHVHEGMLAAGAATSPGSPGSACSTAAACARRRRGDLGVGRARVAVTAAGKSPGGPWGLRRVLSRCRPAPTATAEPVWEPVPQAEAARGETLLVRCADSAALLDVGRVHIGGERCDQRMEHVCRKGHERRECGIRVWEGDVESEDGGGIRPCVVVSRALDIPSWLQVDGVPLRTKMTPDQRAGSPGVKLTNTPWGHDCLSPALKVEGGPGQRSHVHMSRGLGMKERIARTTPQEGSAAVKTATLPSSATPFLVVCHIMLSMNMYDVC